MSQKYYLVFHNMITWYSTVSNYFTNKCICTIYLLLQSIGEGHYMFYKLRMMFLFFSNTSYLQKNKCSLFLIFDVYQFDLMCRREAKISDVFVIPCLVKAAAPGIRSKVQTQNRSKIEASTLTFYFIVAKMNYNNRCGYNKKITKFKFY